MAFLVPAFLAGLAALLVPLLLHLRHRDKDAPQRFPSLMFLERLPIRTAERRRITDWPLLLLRALALVLLVLAFARPFVSVGRAASSAGAVRTVILLVDRSMSMGHREVWPAALDSARRVLNGLGPRDRVALVLFDDEAEVVQPFTADRALALAALSKAMPGSAGTRYAAALRVARQLAADEGGERVEIVLVTDLQRSGASGVAGLELPANFVVRTVAVTTADRANARVGTVDARRSERSGRQFVSIRTRVASRDARASRQMSVMLRLNGRASGTVLVNVPATGEALVAFEPVPVPAGVVSGQVTIDSDALAADDTAHFIVNADDALRVLLVASEDVGVDETMYLERALAVSGTPNIRVERTSGRGLDARKLGDAALVMVWDGTLPSGSAGAALTEWVTLGGGLVVVAGRRLEVSGTATSLVPASVSVQPERANGESSALGDVRVDHPLLAPFRDARAALYAARFRRHARLLPAARGDVIARFDDGSAAIVERREGAGRVVVVAVPLDARGGDFPLQEAFLPFVRQLVVHTAGREASAPARMTGERWTLPGALREPVVAAPGGSIVRPTRDAKGASVPLREAGLYSLYDGGVRGSALRMLAANAPASESDLTPMSRDELLIGIRQGTSSPEVETQPLAPEVAERRQAFWRLLIAALAVLLVAEMLFANRGWRGTANRLARSPQPERSDS